MRLLWMKAAVSLAAIWLTVAGVLAWTHRVKPSPKSVVEYLEAHPVEGRAPEERRKVIDGVTGQLNRLDMAERREARADERPGQFFKKLTPDEQAHFIDQTVPEGFKQMLEALNKMTPEKRVRFVVKAVEDMRKQREAGGEAPPRLDDPNVQKIMSVGLKSFYADATPETKLALAPLIEEMQRNLTGW